jgi:hypothetical protein
MKLNHSMKTPFISILAVLATVGFHGTCLASTDATCLIYQPISMRSEGKVIRLPEAGFLILPVPYLSAFSVTEKPYDAITLPYRMLSMRNQQGTPDSNVASGVGIKIQSSCTFDGNKLKEEVVSVDFSKFQAKDDGPTLEVVAEAVLECIRHTATDERQDWMRPVVRIIGKPADEAMWERWEEVFNKQDFTKPFKRPEKAVLPTDD